MTVFPNLDYQDITVDGDGHVYVVGYTESTNFPVTGNASQPTKAGAFDAFITVLNAPGSALIYSSYLGGDEKDQAHVRSLRGTTTAIRSLVFSNRASAWMRTATSMWLEIQKATISQSYNRITT